MLQDAASIGSSSDAIIINVMVQAEQAKKQLKEINARMKAFYKESAAYTKQAVKAQSKLNKVTGNSQKAMDKRADLTQEVSQYTKLATQATQQAVQAETALAKQKLVVAKNTNAVNKAMGKTRVEFPAWALSIMFLGMQLTSVFQNIWRSATTTFNSVMNSIRGTYTGFNILEGSLKYLGFSAGQALEPIVWYLIPIIDKMSKWINQNEEAFRTFAVTFGIGGSVLSGLGMIALGINAIVGLFAKIASIKIFDKLAAGATKFSNFFKTTLLPILKRFSRILGPIAFVIALGWDEAWETIKNITSGIWTTVADLFSGLGEMASAFFEILDGLFEGDLEKMFDGVVKLVVSTVKTALQLVSNVATLIEALFIGIVNTVSLAFFNLIDYVINLIESAINLANRLPWVNISTNGISEVRNQLASLQSMATIDYDMDAKTAERKSEMDAFFDSVLDKMGVDKAPIHIDSILIQAGPHATGRDIYRQVTDEARMRYS